MPRLQHGAIFFFAAYNRTSAAWVKFSRAVQNRHR